MAIELKNYIIGGIFKVKIRESQLRNMYSDTSQTVVLESILPDGLRAMILDGNVYAGLSLGGSVDNVVEMVQIENNSYNLKSNTLNVMRLQSSLANGTRTSALYSTYNTELYLNFNVVNPKLLQEIQDLYTYAKKNINGVVATQNQTGEVRLNYKNRNTAENEPAKVITSDSPALNGVYRSLIGAKTEAVYNELLTEYEVNRLQTLQVFIDWVVANNNFDKTMAIVNLLSKEGNLSKLETLLAKQ